MTWERVEGGYERTRDPELIENLLEEIRDYNLWVQFMALDFRSGPTILIEIRKQELVFDMPRPWNPLLEQARIVYRDRTKIFHSFRVEIIKTQKKKNIVITSKPQEIYRLQRRRFYRIEVPEPSKAYFKCQEQRIKGRILNISACGMAILTNQGLKLPVGEKISQIELSLYLTPNKPFGEICLTDGRIARTEEKEDGHTLYGIEFLIERDRDRQPLIRYVIKREIEIRKLVND